MLRLACAFARAAGWLSRRTGRGGGTTLPGVVLLRLRPNAIAELAAKLDQGVVLISATNGKTTTTRLAVTAVESLGLRVVTNAEGSNLERGIAAALLDLGNADIAVFEVDEAALPAVAKAVAPRLLVLMNLFRDQLDRYGELDTLVETWRSLLSEPALRPTRLILNGDDPNIAALGFECSGPVTWFGVDDRTHALPERAHAADATSCRLCGAPLTHDVVLLGHLGHWHCPNGDAARPNPDVSAVSVSLGADGQVTELAIPHRPQTEPSGPGEPAAMTVRSSLTGLHNAYNLTAAAAVGLDLGGADRPVDRIAQALGQTPAAFGRGERIAIDDGWLNLLLAKNPTGVNQNIRTVLADDADLHVLALLNDRTADGRDVSWIWDVDWEPLAGRLKSLTLAGTRAHDLALRFKYGGFDMELVTIEPDPSKALDLAMSHLDETCTLHTLATYTAMLDLRAELVDRGHVDPYWEAP